MHSLYQAIEGVISETVFMFRSTSVSILVAIDVPLLSSHFYRHLNIDYVILNFKHPDNGYELFDVL